MSIIAQIARPLASHRVCLTGIAALFVLLPACGGTQRVFAPRFPDNQADHIDAVLSRIASAPPRRLRPVVVGVSEAPQRLFAYDFEGHQVLWEQEVTSRSAPQLAGPLVVMQEDPGLVARDLDTGAVRFRTDDDALHLIGADGEGEVGAIVLSTGGGVGARSRLIALRGGAIDWEIRLEHALGAPAVRAGMIFVPWGNQNVSVMDGLSGEEIARLRVADEMLGTALATEDAVYVGHRGVMRLTATATTGLRDQSAWFQPPELELPGNPGFMLDAYRPPQSPDSARHSVRLEWHPAGRDETVQLADRNLYLVFYRLVFALDPETGAIRWVHEHSADVVGASARPGGIMLGNAEGSLVFLSASDGRVSHSTDMGQGASGLRFRLGTHEIALTPQGDAAPLRDQLLSAAQNNDARLVPARLFALRQLVALPEGEVTTNLIALCDASQMPEAIRDGACAAVASRTSGAEAVISTLGRHQSFLAGTTTPPVGPLAQAAAGMQDRRAVPMLVAHLRDPATASEDLASLLRALGSLGDSTAADSVADFLRLYHADAVDDPLAVALDVAVETLVALEGPVAGETLQEVADDPLTIPRLAQTARTAIAVLEEAAGEDVASESTGDEGAADTAGGGADEGSDGGSEEATPGEPVQVTTAVMDRVLGPVRPQMTACLTSATGSPRSARIILRLQRDGAIERLSISPQTVASCVEPLVRAQSFPRNPGPDEQIIYTLRR